MAEKMVNAQSPDLLIDNNAVALQGVLASVDLPNTHSPLTAAGAHSSCVAGPGCKPA
jgi:hypothetical protein